MTQSDEPGTASPTVLVAEDEHLVAESLCADLRDLGYTVVGPFANGRAAIDAAGRERPDLALLDIRIADVDGLGVASELRALGVPCLILSAYSTHDYVERGTAAGVYGYLLKPISRDELRVALQVAFVRAGNCKQQHERILDLETQLHNRKVIERAKGLLQTKLGMSEPEAMRRLQKQARDARRPMAELAQSLLDAEELLRGTEAVG